MTTKDLLVVAFCLSSSVTGETGELTDPDYQARFLLHRAVRGGADWTGWAIVPDVTNHQPLRGLVLGGIVVGTKSQWLELMGGTFIGTNGSSEPVLDLRTLVKGKRLMFFGEIQYATTSRRLLVGPAVTIPFRLGEKTFGVGGEMDYIILPSGNVLAAGPRVVLPVPLCNKCSLAVAYQFRTGRSDIVRSYFLVNF